MNNRTPSPCVIYLVDNEDGVGLMVCHVPVGAAFWLQVNELVEKLLL